MAHAQVQNEVIERLSGKPTTLSVYVSLALHGRPGSEIWPSLGRLVELTGLSRRTVQRHMKILLEMGLLIRGKRLVRGPVVYSLYKATSDTMGERYQATSDTGKVPPVTCCIRTDNRKDNFMSKKRNWMTDEEWSLWSPWLSSSMGHWSEERTQSKDAVVWSSFRKVSRDGNVAQRAKLHDIEFLVQLRKESTWSKPSDGLRAAGYGKRVKITLERLLSGVKSPAELESSRQAALARRMSEIRRTNK